MIEACQAGRYMFRDPGRVHPIGISAFQPLRIGFPGVVQSPCLSLHQCRKSGREWYFFHIDARQIGSKSSPPGMRFE